MTKAQKEEILDKILLSCKVYFNEVKKEPDRFIADIKEYVKEYEKRNRKIQ